MKIAQEKKMQDEVVVVYINALQNGAIAEAEKYKKDINHFYAETSFEYTVPETIAMYAHLTNKHKAYEHLLKHELFPKFYLPEDRVKFLCAIYYGYTGMFDAFIALDTEYFWKLLQYYYLIKSEKRKVNMVHNTDLLKYIMKSYPDKFLQCCKLLLKYALKNNDKETLDYWRAHNTRSISDEGVLALCVKYGRLEILKEKFVHEINLDDMYNLLSHAASHGRLEILEYLILSDSNVMKNGQEAILNALSSAQLQSIEFLVSHGAQISTLEMRNTKFDEKVWRNMSSSNIIKVLEFCKEYPNISFEKSNLLESAIMWERKQVVEYLLKDVDLRALSDPENTVITENLHRTSFEIALYLRDKGFVLTKTDEPYLVRRLLFMANKDLDAVKKILSIFKIDIKEYASQVANAVMRRSDAFDVIKYFYSIGCKEALNAEIMRIGGYLYIPDILEFVSPNTECYTNSKWQYVRVCKQLIKTADPMVKSVPFYTGRMPKKAAKLQRGIFAFYEIAYCAPELPTEVVFLIAQNIVGVEFDINTLFQCQFITKLSVPREIEMTSPNMYNCKSKYDEYDTLERIKILYLEHNQSQTESRQV